MQIFFFFSSFSAALCVMKKNCPSREYASHIISPHILLYESGSMCGYFPCCAKLKLYVSTTHTINDDLFFSLYYTIFFCSFHTTCMYFTLLYPIFCCFHDAYTKRYIFFFKPHITLNKKENLCYTIQNKNGV